MNSKERITCTLNHREPDKIPLDLGGSSVTGMHVSVVYQLRQRLGLDSPGTPVKIIDPAQMLGEIDFELIKALGIDVIPLVSKRNIFGFENSCWKKWKTFDGTPVLVPNNFNTKPEENGDILIYPQGDNTVPASGRMPKDGYYFDSVNRQTPIIDDDTLAECNLEEFKNISDEDLNYFSNEARHLSKKFEKGIVANFGGTSFGDIGLVPAPFLKNPRGIRSIEEWYISLVARPKIIETIFLNQCKIALCNLEKIASEIGHEISVIRISGTDFGAQNNPLISLNTYRRLFKPFHLEVNNWIHHNTSWKTFIHTDGSIKPFINDFIEAGFDILNPVQFSAFDMDTQEIKNKYGDRIVFWGGGIDTQHTLVWGSTEDVKEEVIKQINILRKQGGFVFSAVHNIQFGTPIENIMTMFDTFNEYR